MESQFLKVPPNSIEAEEAVLGGLMLSPGAIERVIETLREEAFYLVTHQKIYRAILTLRLEGKPTDAMFVANKLEEIQELHNVGGRSKLADLLDRTVSDVNIDQLSDLLIQKWIRRQIITQFRELLDFAETPANTNEEILAYGSRIIDGFQESITSELKPISEIAIAGFTKLEGVQSGDISPSVKTGYLALDGLTGGLSESTLTIIAGRPSMGKTALGLEIAENISRVAPVVVFSLEMSSQQLVERMICSKSQLPTNIFKMRDIKDFQWDKVVEATNKISGLSIYVNDSRNITPSSILAQCRWAKKRNNGVLGAVVVDYLQLMSKSNQVSNEVSELDAITLAFRQLSGELKVPVILLCQINRGCESRNDKRPLLSDLKGSGAIEQHADMVMILYRDDYYNPQSEEQGIVEINVAKHRNGPTGTVKMLFDRQFTTFRDILPRHQ